LLKPFSIFTRSFVIANDWSARLIRCAGLLTVRDAIFSGPEDPGTQGPGPKLAYIACVHT